MSYLKQFSVRFLVAVLFVFLFSVVQADAATYYLSPTGNDASGTGSETSPWFTLQKAWTVIAPGDTVYLRGGTYTYTKQQGLIGKNGTAGNLIKIWAYPGENPVITRSATGYTTDIYWHRSGIFFTGNYFHFKGLEITGFKNINGNIENGFLGYDASNNTFEQLNIHHNHHGFYLENNSGNNLILNSDFHDNYDTQGSGGNSDGVGLSYNTSTNNVIDGCRAWNNGDDGFDTFEHKGLVTIKNSWAWHNGYVYGTSTPAGNGVGFKLGSNFLQGTTLQNTVVRIVQNTISADNRDSGYHINEGDHRTQLYNNVSYGNEIAGLNFHWNNLVHTFKNNVSFGNGNTQVEVSSNSISTNNSYGIGGYSDGGPGWAQTASNADFVSTDITQLDNPRQSNGSLPIITAFTLASTSDLINAGTNVGLPYSGSAPDIGAFEYGTTTPPPNTIAIGDRVQVSSGPLNVRATASTTGTLLGTQPTNALGTVIGGPTVQGGYTWWNINYDNAPDGWSVETYLIETTTPPPSNQPPVSNAGPDQTITLPTNSVTLTGSGTDTDGTIASYAWTKVSTLAGTITTPSAATTTLTGLAQGTHTFRLTVTDNQGATGTDDVMVVVNGAVTPPTTGTYYLSPTGNDATGNGSISAPWFTLEKVWTVIQPGNTVYLRGGTYAYSDMQYLQGKNGTAGNLIKIWAYPGETPNITRSSNYKIVNGVDQDLIYFEGNYFHFKGIEISYFEQKPTETSYPAFRAGFTSYSIFENINYHHNMSGFQIRGNSTGNLILNSDFHHNKDPYGDAPYDGADGLGITFNYDPNSVNTIRGSRAYWNADDGFDTWENAGHVIIENSWAFYNGYLPDTFTAAGNGTAFKLGSIATPSSQTKRTLKNNLAYKNRFAGFVENNAGVKMELYNNTSVNAGYAGYWFGAWSGNGNVTIAKNNIDHQGVNPPGPWNTASTVTNNSWQNNLTVTDADFVSLDGAQLLGVRQADNSLPSITAFHLASTSDLINAGTNVGLPYSGTAPDVGAFEYSSTTPPPTDTIPPTTSLTSPTNNQTLSGTTTLSATATDNTAVTKVDFLRGTTLLGSDTTSPYTYTWNTTTSTNGTYQLSTKAYDMAGNVGTSTTVSVVVNNTVANTPPTASAGPDQTITLPTNSVTLTGSGTDTDGTIASYAWTKVSTLAGTITTPSAATTTLTGLAQGTHTFRLTVTDNQGATGTDDVNVVVNQAPASTKFAIGDRVYVSSGPLNVRATASTTGTLLGRQQVNALGVVSGGPVRANNRNWWNINYDNAPDGWSVETYLEKYVTPPTDTIPPTTSLTSPTNNQTLSGTTTLSATATDNTAVTKVDFLRGTTLLGSDTTSPYTYTWNTTTSTNGTYQLSTKAYDMAGNVGTSTTVSVVVNNTTTPPPAGNQINMANVVLDGGYGYRIGGQSFGTLADNVSNPTRSLLRLFENGVALSTPHADHGEINTLGLGRYSHWVDENGWEAIYFSTSNNSDPRTNGKIYTYIISPSNQPPVSNAGPDQTITLPTNSVTLTGGATDPDGNTMTYAWTKISGTGGTITSPNSLSTTVTGLTQGTYSYWLTVTDSQGATNADQVVITVNGQPSSFTDNFDRANSTDVGSNWTERYGASNFRINSNKLQLNVNDGQVSSLHTTSGITSANYTVQSKISFPTRDSIMYAGVSGRRINYGATDSEGYMAYIEPYDSLLTLYKRVAGQWTRLGEYSITMSANTLYTIGLSMNGSSIKALWNGSPVISVTDTTFLQAGSAGAITGDGYTMAPIVWDDLTINSQ